LTRNADNILRINLFISRRYKRLVKYNRVLGTIFALLGLYFNLIRNLYKYSDTRINLRFSFLIEVVFIEVYRIILIVEV